MSSNPCVMSSVHIMRYPFFLSPSPLIRWLMLLLMVAPFPAAAQRVLTLPEALETAFQASFSARNARELLRSSEASAQAARRALYSTVDLTLQAPDYSRRLLQTFNPSTQLTEYYPIENYVVQCRLEINQPVIWTNSTISLAGVLNRQDQSTVGSSTLTRSWYTNLVLMLRQPLLVPNTQRIAFRQATLDYEEALAEYRRALLELSYQVTESFYRTYAAQEQLVIQQDRVRQQEESHATALRKYRSGLIAEVEALQFEVDLATARNDFLSAENAGVSRMNSFKLLIGLPLSDSLRLVLPDTTFHALVVNQERAVDEAKRTRVDLQRARNSVERGGLQLEQVEAQRMIRGDITLSYGINKDDTDIERLFRDPRDTRSAMLTISIPVFDWGKHSMDVQSAEARLRSAEYSARQTELTIEQEIDDVVRRIRSAGQRVLVMQQSRVIAEKANFISTKRFDVGTIGAVELAQSQARLLQARLSALEALIDYNVAVADLTRRTGYDFLVDRPVTFTP